jgi:murein L,D-transpeptidase YafK
MQHLTPLRLLAAILFLAGLVAAAFTIRGWMAQDSCLDSGGAWYGRLGCERNLPLVDRIVVLKSERRLEAYSGRQLIRAFHVSLGKAPVGDKSREGDNRTPEGSFDIVFHKADSDYHLALQVGYPTREQIAKARVEGRNPGGEIMIHGAPNGYGWVGRLHLIRDWTAGCIALTNDEIEWLFAVVPQRGAVVDIRK